MNIFKNKKKEKEDLKYKESCDKRYELMILLSSAARKVEVCNYYIKEKYSNTITSEYNFYNMPQKMIDVIMKHFEDADNACHDVDIFCSNNSLYSYSGKVWYSDRFEHVFALRYYVDKKNKSIKIKESDTYKQLEKME